MHAIETVELVKDFAGGPTRGGTRALAGVTLTVGAGQIVGLLGPNGSGKSTLLKTMAGLLIPTAGTCRIFGRSPASPDARRELGFLPEAPGFPPHLTGAALLRYHARLAGVARSRLSERGADVIRQTGLAAAVGRRTSVYSRGQRQRLGLALAMVNEPRILLLDEPLSGLDPAMVRDVCGLLGRLRSQGRTIVLSSHLLPQAASVCDRIVLLHGGRVLRHGSLPEIIRRPGERTLLVDRLPAGAEEDLRRWLRARGAGLREKDAAGCSLEDAFLDSIGEANGRGAGGL